MLHFAAGQLSEYGLISQYKNKNPSSERSKAAVSFFKKNHSVFCLGLLLVGYLWGENEGQILWRKAANCGWCTGMLSYMYINTHDLCYICLIKMQDERRVHRWDPLLTPRQHRGCCGWGFHSRILQGSLMRKRWNHCRKIYIISCTSFNWKCTHEPSHTSLCVQTATCCLFHRPIYILVANHSYNVGLHSVGITHMPVNRA